MFPLEHELTVATELGRRAAGVVLRYFRTDLDVDRKAGDEPVTRADRESEALIVEGLRREFPADGVLSEESTDHASWAGHRRAWLVDPLDGTKDFIERLDGFSVMIGLLEERRPVLGVICQPVTGRVFRAAAGLGAEMLDGEQRTPLSTSSVAETTRLRLVVSNSHRSERIDDVKQALRIADEQRLGSVGLKIGLVARGLCDLYVHPSGHCKLWDVCAPHAVLALAGGRMTDLHGDPLAYDPRTLHVTAGILASNGACHDEVLRRIAPLFPRPRR